MAQSSLTLWIDVETNRLLNGWNSNNEAPIPTFVAGDSTDIEIHLVRQNASSQFEELSTAGKSFKLAIGLIDRMPNGGFWTVAYGNSQIDFDFNETAESVEQALNAIPEIIADGGVTVSLVNADTTYRVVFNNKVALSSTFSTDASNLLPSSIVQKNEVKVGSATTKGVWHFKPKQIPVAYQPNWYSSANSSVISLTDLGGGVQRLAIAPNAPQGGTFTLDATRVDVKKYAPNLGATTTTQLSTFPISVNATEADFDNALPAFESVASTTNTNGFTVKKVGAYTWDFTTQSVLNQFNSAWYDSRYEITSVSNSAIIQFSYVYSSISLNNYETASLLAGIGEATAVLEVEITENDSVTTVLQTPCRIVNDIIGQSTYSPTPFDDPVTQSDLDSALALKYDASNPLGFVPEAPIDNYQYSRQNGQWQVIELDGNNIPNYNNFVTYTVGSQVYFQGKLYRMVSAVGGAGYDPVAYPANWESLSGTSPDLTGYATELWVGSQNYLTASSLAGYATESWVTGKGYLTSSSLLGYAEQTWVQNYVSGFGYLTVGDYPISLIIGSNYKSHRDRAESTYTHTYYDPYFESNSTIDITVAAPEGLKYDGWSVQFTDSQPLNYVSVDEVNRTLTFGVYTNSGETMQYAINYTFTGSGSVVPAGWNLTFSNGGSSYALANALASGTTVLTPPRLLSQGFKPVLEGGVIYDLTIDAKAYFEYNKFLSTDAYGNVGWTSISSALGDYALRSGTTFTGKVNCTPVSGLAGINIGIGGVQATANVAGDMWIATGGTVLNYRDAGSAVRIVAARNLANTFTNAQTISIGDTIPALRITQTGTGNALVVEDATNPDTTAFVVNASGAVGVLKDPATWVPATGVALDVTGKGVFSPTGLNNPSLNLGATACNTAPTLATAGDIWITNATSPKLAFQTGGVNYYCVIANQFNTFTGQVAISGTSATNPQLAITQGGSANALTITTTGTGRALVVEDATSPDTTATVIDNAGNVGIGVDPATWVPSAKLEVKGGIKFNDGSVQTTSAGSASRIDARQYANETQFLSPRTGHWMLMNPNIIQIQRAGFNVTNTGTITTTNAGWISSYTQVGTAGACSSRWRTFGLSQVDQVHSMTNKATPSSSFDFSNQSWCSGRSVLLGVTESVFTWGFYHGKNGNSDGVGDLVRRGYGWKATGGAGSRFLSLEVHNGTTLTSVTSSYAVTSGVAFDWDIQSDGLGNVTLWINQTLVASTGAGPTGTVNETPVVWSEEVSTSGASISPWNGMVHSRGKFIAFDP